MMNSIEGQRSDTSEAVGGIQLTKSRDLQLKQIPHSVAKEVFEKNHYSGSITGGTQLSEHSPERGLSVLWHWAVVLLWDTASLETPAGTTV